MTKIKFLGVAAIALSTALACAPSPLTRDNDPEDPNVGDAGRSATPTSDAGGGGRDGGTASGGNKPDSGPGGGGGGGGGSLSGSYALLIDVPQVWTVSLLGTHPALLRLLVRVNFSGDVPTINFDGNVCDMEILYDGNLTVAVPETAAPAVPPVTGSGTLNMTTDSIEVSGGPVYSLAGWNGATPTEALPITLDDPRVTDPDGDGNPGITFNLVAPGIITGDIYVAIRATVGFQASTMSIDRFDATSSSDVEISILGATSGLAPRGLIQSVPGADSLKRFSMASTRDNSCEAIRAAKATLFP